MAPGASVKLGVVRKGSERTMTLTLGELPKQREARADTSGSDAEKGTAGPLGLSLAPANTVAGSGQQGVVVTQVDPNGVGAEHGFRTGDVILEVGSKTVSKPADVTQAMDEARSDGKRVVLIRVKSGSATKFVAVPVSRA